jgi:hypothetical protein
MNKGYVQARMYSAFIKYAVETPRWTYEDAVAKMGWDNQTLRRYINALHDDKLVHVADLLPDCRGRRTIRQFTWGPGKDFELEKKTPNEYRKGKVARLKAEAEAAERAKAWTGPVTQPVKLHPKAVPSVFDLGNK